MLNVKSVRDLYIYIIYIIYIYIRVYIRALYTMKIKLISTTKILTLL